jgi:UDP-N-acetyl-2-amino-2-deoxyglucuronate dehydrogenase
MYAFAIIGCGNVARLHAEQISKAGKLQAVCDPKKDRADALASEFGATAYYSFEDLLNHPSIDIFSICTPNGYHAEQCIKALQAGRHVFCEAPLCLTKAGAWQIIETEKYCRRKLFVFNAAAQPKLLELKATIREHTNGHLYHFDLQCVSHESMDYYKGWRGRMFPGGGALYTNFANHVDMLISLFGEIDSVRGTVSNLRHTGNVEFEDEGTAAVRTRNGIEGTIRWQLEGGATEGPAFSISNLNKPIKLSADELAHMLTADGAFYERSYRNFIEALESGETSSAGLYESTKTIEGIERIYRAVSPNPSFKH